MSESVNGWSPPLIYDVMTDTKRIATQGDIDRMQSDLALLGSFYSETKRRAKDIEIALRQGFDGT